MTTKLRPLPNFASEADERAFWEQTDSADYLDLSEARPAVFPDLKPTTNTNFHKF